MALLGHRPPRLPAFAAGLAARCRLRTLALAVAAIIAAPAAAQPRTPSEAELKAAFLHRIAGFVEWPEKPAGTPLRLCLLGGNPFGAALDAIRGKPVQGRPLEVRAAEPGDALRDCQILFVAAAADRHVERIAALSRGAGILTVGDGEGYARRGVMLNFYLDHDRVRFEVNLEAMRRGEIKVSSKLLSLARIVDAGELKP